MSNDRIETLLADLCKEALLKEGDGLPHPAMFFMRAPEGRTLAQESTSISLSQRGARLLRKIADKLRSDKELRVRLSESEVQGEVVTSLFEGTEALEQRTFDQDVLAKALFARLKEGRQVWEIYIPIAGLELPDGCDLALACGTFKGLGEKERNSLKDENVNILNQTVWESVQKRESGSKTLIRRLDETIDASKYWFHISVAGRARAAEDLARESALLAMDILRFWSLLNGIDAEACSLRLPTQAGPSIMRYVQLAKGQSLLLGFESGASFPYRLDSHLYAKLTSLPEFKKVQAISNKSEPTDLERKFLLGIQQYAEATRLPAPTSRLVWYISALETVLAKEANERKRRGRKVEARIRKLLGDEAAGWLDPLYSRRDRSVHYGLRNRISDELVTALDLGKARTLAYRGIASALKHIGAYTDQDRFLDFLDKNLLRID